MSDYNTFTSPLAARNASPRMLRLWSPRYKFDLWRNIWLAVAQSQHELGLPVSAEQVAALQQAISRGIRDEDIQRAEAHERIIRHDVMSHVHAFGECAPQAAGIIHLGMTSQDVVCNADLIQCANAYRLIWCKVSLIALALGDFAHRYRDLPTLGFTHYQAAQPVTVGRRAANWASDLLEAEHLGPAALRTLRGLRGATGTQASFLALCNNDPARVDQLERAVCDRLTTLLPPPIPTTSPAPGGSGGVSPPSPPSPPSPDPDCFELTGQTYPRIHDARILAQLASIAAVLHKIATDIRLLSNRKEIDEPFEDKQIGSSAMPYKRNPMRCERICGLARFVMNMVGNAYDTAATQWMERTLDDSSNRRLSLAESFLALDGALDIMLNVTRGLVVHEAITRRNLLAELPFMATENILMECVRLGGNRQHYHELIRAHAQAAGQRVKNEGLDNDLLDRLRNDPEFHPTALKGELNWEGLLDPARYIGRSIEQTQRFIARRIEPLKSIESHLVAIVGESTLRV